MSYTAVGNSFWLISWDNLIEITNRHGHTYGEPGFKKRKDTLYTYASDTTHKHTFLPKFMEVK